ncbi:gluconokinase [Colwellia sp. RSH04]|uniref:gluconokinase n=1 Tax=Colwellia sp. RSH04 TaxID=2305464 RepID=UPI000E56856C|nr:gluconokinase [Colwellia sp. RSH04]RHW75324.1 gluconokinase [Colwellia sp. RSH04]
MPEEISVSTHHLNEFKRPYLFIIMGVSGTGKSSVAKRLTLKLNQPSSPFELVEADDFHSKEAKALMASGIPLDDDMRLPWIERIIAKIEYYSYLRKNVVLAYSGLKYQHRQLFRQLNVTNQFFWLNVSEQELFDRLDKRNDHFFNSKLLSNQIQTMQAPQAGESDICPIECKGSIADVCSDIEEKCRLMISC